MSQAVRTDVSVVLPFGDDEEVIGAAVRTVAIELRTRGLGFEILAVDEDAGDNSHAVLALLRAEVSELRVTHAPGRGRGVEVGSTRAQGRVLFIVTPHVAVGGVADAVDALEQFIGSLAGSETDNARDAEIAIGRYTIAHRMRALPAITGSRVIGEALHRRLAKRFQVKGLRVLITGGGGASRARVGLPRWRAFAFRNTFR